MQTLDKRSSESVRFDIDCSLMLAAGEAITGVTSINATPVTSPALSFGSPAVNGQAVTYTDPDTGISRIAPIGTVIQVQISGGAIASGLQVQDYVIRALFATNINPAVEATVRLKLNDTPPL